jgi:hypothetical protein
MAQQQLSLIISAIDRATGPINKIRQSINGLGGGATKATQQAGGLSNAIAFGMVKAQAAIAGVTMGYQKLTGAFRAAADAELEIMNAASGIAALAGIEFNEAAKFVDGFEASLAKTVERLPGATSSYISLSRAISDNVATAFQDAEGKIPDMDKFAKGLSRMSAAAGFLGASANLPQELTNIAISNALGGMSQKELRQLAFFQRNPAVLAGLDRNLDQYAKKLGKASLTLSQIDPESRMMVLLKTLEDLAGPEQQERSGKSVKGIFEGLRSSLFDPKGGIFGLERDLDEALEGTQNAYQQYAKLINSIFGVTGILATLAKPLERMGFSSLGTRDPMKILANAFEWLDNQAQRLNTWLDKAQAKIPNLTPENFGFQLSRFVNFVQGKILEFLQGPALDNVGEMIAEIINAATGAIVSVITGADAGQTSSVVGRAFVVIVREIADALAGLSWQSWAVIISAALTPVIVGAAVTGLSAMLTKAIGTALLAAVMSPAFASAAVGILTAVTGFFGAIAAVPAALFVVAGALTLASIRVFTTRWGEIVDVASGFFQEIAKTFRGAIQVVIGVLTGNLGQIQAGMQSLVDGVMGWINQARDTWAIITGGQTTATKAAIAGRESADARIKAGGGRINADGSVTGPIRVPNGAAGFGLAPWLESMARERRAAPAGAGIVVANTTETILTRQQAGAVGGALANRGSGGNTSITNHFNISGAGDPQRVAEQVMRIFQIRLDEQMQGSLV